MKTKFLLFGAIIALSFFISCDTNEKIEDTSAISDEEITADANIDAAADDVSLIVEDQYAIQQSLSSKIGSNKETESSKSSNGIVSVLPQCATITTVLANGTWTRTIDFGTEGCTLHNGNILKGKIIITFSNNFTTATRTMSYSFVGFYHNGKLIQGNKSIIQTLKSTELLATIHPVFTHTIDMNITFANDKVYSRKGTRVKEMIEGFTTTANWEDNVFLVWGYHVTSSPSGTKITTTITTPLRFVMACRKPFPVSGVVSITKNDATAVLDFGNGECDNLATITKDGITKEIRLEKKD